MLQKAELIPPARAPPTGQPRAGVDDDRPAGSLAAPSAAATAGLPRRALLSRWLRFATSLRFYEDNRHGVNGQPTQSGPHVSDRTAGTDPGWTVFEIPSTWSVSHIPSNPGTAPLPRGAAPRSAAAFWPVLEVLPLSSRASASLCVKATEVCPRSRLARAAGFCVVPARYLHQRRRYPAQLCLQPRLCRRASSGAPCCRCSYSSRPACHARIAAGGTPRTRLRNKKQRSA
ncbi:hypothetical protein PAHAL_3G200300 [Panicum hallii]|uniref:Uncharacterized protein n=1 Tax=Panicum hallii TaxID=206008 RepID=A0A2T8KIT9_9POAL|nr:hypothetical protein PAHAL_3G200300 [Panicum hallii]